MLKEGGRNFKEGWLCSFTKPVLPMDFIRMGNPILEHPRLGQPAGDPDVSLCCGGVMVRAVTLQLRRFRNGYAIVWAVGWWPLVVGRFSAGG